MIVGLQIIVAGKTPIDIGCLGLGEKINGGFPAIHDDPVQAITGFKVHLAAGTIGSTFIPFFIHPQINCQDPMYPPGIVDGVLGIKMVGLIELMLGKRQLAAGTFRFPTIIFIIQIQPVMKIPDHQQGPGESQTGMGRQKKNCEHEKSH